MTFRKPSAAIQGYDITRGQRTKSAHAASKA